MEAVAPELAYASWPRRILSAAIDYFVISFLAAPFSGNATRRIFDALRDDTPVRGSDLRTILVVNLIAIVVYTTAFHAWRGATLGKMAARTVLVNEDGTPITLQAAFVRSVALAAIQFISALLIAPMIVNELRPLWTPRRQTWHDQVAKTVVVTAESPSRQNLTD